LEVTEEEDLDFHFGDEERELLAAAPPRHEH
jgi:hypothetical protein